MCGYIVVSEYFPPPFKLFLRLVWADVTQGFLYLAFVLILDIIDPFVLEVLLAGLVGLLIALLTEPASMNKVVQGLVRLGYVLFTPKLLSERALVTPVLQTE